MAKRMTVRLLQAGVGTAAMAMTLAGCSSEKNMWSTVPEMPPTPPTVFAKGAAAIEVPTVAVTIAHRRSIGNLSRNVGCWVNVRDLTDADFPQGAVVTDALRSALTDAHVPVNGASPGTGYRLVARIGGAHLDMCDNTFFETGPYTVDAAVDIAWRLEAPGGNPVMFETSTSGIGHHETPGPTADAAVADAVADAVRRLLQTAAMQQYLGQSAPAAARYVAAPAPAVPPAIATGTAPIAAPPAAPAVTPAPARAVAEAPALPPILIAIRSPGGAKGQPVEPLLQRTTLTVAGNPPGLGFPLGSDGYALISGDMMPTGGPVTVITASGQRIGAETVRRDPSFAFVLIKTAIALPEPLGLEPQHPAAGALVHGIAGGHAATATVAGPAENSGNIPLSGAPFDAGSAVVDDKGDVVGVMAGNGEHGPVMMPIATVFRRLRLGASLGND